MALYGNIPLLLAHGKTAQQKSMTAVRRHYLLLHSFISLFFLNVLRTLFAFSLSTGYFC